MNFVWRTRSDTFVGTAGHCFVDSDEVVYGDNSPVARDANDAVIGRVAYAVVSARYDFALVRLRRGVQWSPKMCVFRGPLSVNHSYRESGGLLQFYGNGWGVGRIPELGEPTLPARELRTDSFSDRERIYATGAAAWGDSGSGILDDQGNAVGVLTHITSERILVYRLPHLLARARSMLGFALRIVLVR